MTDLTTLNTAYPDTNPWSDLRPFLVNGWRSLGAQTCGVSAAPNQLFWSMRLIGDDATSWTFMDALPGNFRPPQNLPVTIFSPLGVSYCLLYRSLGRFSFDTTGINLTNGWDRKGELTVAGVTQRGTSV